MIEKRDRTICLTNLKPPIRIDMIGPLGVGKTTLLNAYKQISKEPSISFIYEDLSRIKQEIAYWNKDKKKRAYFMQSAYYLETYSRIIELHKFSGLILSDSSILYHHFGYTNILLNKGLIEPLEYKQLAVLNSSLESHMPKLVGVIYCHADPITIFNQVAKRDRQQELCANRDVVECLLNEGETLVSGLDVAVLDVDFEHTEPDDAAKSVDTFVKAMRSKD